MMNTKIINDLIGVKEAYKAPDTLMKILFDREKRESMFKEFLNHEWKVDYDWFHDYFQDEHADRKLKKQDFTPNSVGKIVSSILSHEKKK